MTIKNQAPIIVPEDANRWSWLIVGGCPRSGTTLLQLLLNTNPNIRITNELSLFGATTALQSVFGREAAFDIWQERAKNHKENWSKATLTPSIPRFQKCAGPMLRAMYQAQFDDQIITNTARFFGDKLPMYYEEDVDALEKLIGKLTIIHLSRNPIDVVNSMLRRSKNAAMGKDTWNLVHSVDDGCMHWARAWNAVQALRHTRQSRLLHLKYEDLVDSTSKVFQFISDSLGVENTFDGSRVVSKDPSERDLVGPREIERIEQLLCGIPALWSESLDELGAQFPTLAR